MSEKTEILCDTRLVQIFSAIMSEFNRAERIHPSYPANMFEQLAIMQEEAGEVTKAVLHYHYEQGSIDKVEKELIQTAAMCIRMLEHNNPWT